jgi:signal transduction histidine kinase
MFLIASFSEMLIVSVGIANKIRLENKERLNLSLQLVKQERELFTKIEESNAAQQAEIAHTLHDSFGARLKQIRSLIELDKPSNAQQKLILLGNEIRDLSHTMSPTILDHLTLQEAISDFIESLNQTKSKLSIYDLSSSDLMLPKKLKTVLYNIALEIINNCLKHAFAKQITIQLGATDNNYIITVEDDGIGFNTKKTKNGIGIQSIRTRIINLGGEFTIESEINKGSLYLIEVPVN